MNSRTWLAVSLCCLIWFGYLQWFAPKPVPKETTTTETQSTTSTPAVGKKSEGKIFDAPIQVSDSVALENAMLRVYFTSQGAKPYRAELLNYHQTIQKDSPAIELFELEKNPAFLGTFFSQADLKPFESSNFGLKERTSKSLKYSLTRSGITLEKTYELKDRYLVSVKYILKLPAKAQDLGTLTVPLSAKGFVSDHNKPLQSWEFVSYQNDAITRKTPEQVPAEELIQQGTTSWIAFGNRYFATAVANSSSINPDVVFLKVQDTAGVALRFPLVAKDKNELVFDLQTYLGPKSASELAVISHGQRLVDYGMFRFLAYPMLDLLRFFYRFVHNYGIAIILLTVMVRILFFPLQMKSAKSMKAMQKLQPQIQSLKEKYKEDMTRFNQEQMALFKTHKVNPLGGCLPIVVQIPVFLALYSVLANSIELFHAPFFGWLRDLSAKDPFYVFPILMGGAMTVQQMMTPMVGMDPAQRKMMMVMPIIMTFFMINLPSGLTVYFFLSTLLGILQQYFTNRDRTPSLVPSPTTHPGSART